MKGTSLLFDVYVLAQVVNEMLSSAMSDSPLTPEEYAVYSHLLEVAPCPPTALARDLRVPATTVTDWVRTMTDRGHARRVARQSDRRSYDLSLTAAGVRAHRSANASFEQVNTAFLAGLLHPEAELRGYLAEIIAATGVRRIETSPRGRPAESWPGHG